MSTHDTTAHQEGRHDRLLKERMHEPYHSKKKLAEPSACPECGAVYHGGRWQWDAAPAGAAAELCPACHRLKDRCPAGFLTLGGEFFAEHKEEILGLVRNVEEKQKAQHALKRLMAFDHQVDGSIVITFTDPELARAAGEAIHAAYKGELDFAYQESEFLLRVTWSR